MARIAGVDLPRRKHILYALPYVYGIGQNLAAEICAKAEIDPVLCVGCDMCAQICPREAIFATEWTK